MADIIKSSSGLLFSEEKWDDLSLLWDLSPNDPSRAALTSGSISLLPGTDRIELLIKAPAENGYVFQSNLEYKPTTATQKAGNTLKSVTDTYIDLQVCGDTTERCNYTKITVNEEYILDAKASLDGKLWIDYGNTRMMDMNAIGFYLEGGANTDPPLKVFNCYMYKSNTVTINNFDRVNLVKLFDITGAEVTDKFLLKKKNSQMCIDGTNLVFPLDYLKIQVCDRVTGAIYHESELRNIFGGDVYEYNYNVDFFIDEVKLTTNMHDLGKISNEKIFTLKISNKESYPLTGKKLKVTYNSIYNPGYKMADISPNSVDAYAKELDVNFTAGETKVFKLKATRGQHLVNIEDEYKFNIVLE